jgi:hypothetical protein
MHRRQSSLEPAGPSPPTRPLPSHFEQALPPVPVQSVHRFLAHESFMYLLAMETIELANG